MLSTERLNSRRVGCGHDDRRRDDAYLIQETRQKVGMLGKVLGVGHGRLGQVASQVVADKDHLVHHPVEPALGQLQVTMVGEDHGPPGQVPQQTQQAGLELGQVDAHHVVLANKPPGQEGKPGHDDALANAKQHRGTDDMHPIHDLLRRQCRIVARGEHRHLVAALGQGRRQAFDIDGQAADVRVVIS